MNRQNIDKNNYANNYQNKRAHTRGAKLPLVLCACLLCISCTASIPYFPVIGGNYSFAQGNFQEATVQYLGALEREQFSEWIYYNLANVYYALGEFEAALDLWSKSLATDNASLLYNVFYNRGILLYEQGRYEDSYESFKSALMHNSSSIRAKKNLELSLLKILSGRGGQRQSNEGELSANSLRILEFVRRKEEQLWLNRENRERDQVIINEEDW